MQWRAKNKYVEIETGEIINEKDIEKYVILRKKRKIIIIKKVTNEKCIRESGTIEWTTECKKRDRQQGKLF